MPARWVAASFIVVVAAASALLLVTRSPQKLDPAMMAEISEAPRPVFTVTTPRSSARAERQTAPAQKAVSGTSARRDIAVTNATTEELNRWQSALAQNKPYSLPPELERNADIALTNAHTQRLIFWEVRKVERSRSGELSLTVPRSGPSNGRTASAAEALLQVRNEPWKVSSLVGTHSLDGGALLHAGQIVVDTRQGRQGIEVEHALREQSDDGQVDDRAHIGLARL